MRQCQELLEYQECLKMQKTNEDRILLTPKIVKGKISENIDNNSLNII
jgi:hypothetical protein